MRKITLTHFMCTLSVAALMLSGISCQSAKKSVQNSPREPIAVATPQRPTGQKDVLQLTTPALKTVRVGFIGLGMRGPGAVKRFTYLDGVEIKALCDLDMSRAEKAQKILINAKLPEATLYGGSEDAWKKLCERDDIDLVYIATDWLHHEPMMIYAMEHGKNVVCEVPSVLNMEEIWNVINTAERTQLHCMMLENCVYDFFELTTLNMAQHGIFGEVLHTEGSYLHCLEPFWDAYANDWRLKYNEEHRGDVYATHGMGPACQLLDIHRGDKMNVLTSMDTKAVGIPEFIKKDRGVDLKDFKNGDMTMTMIRTEKGKTILMQHDVANPRPYSRMYSLTGTKGYASKYPLAGYAIEGSQLKDDDVKKYDELSGHSFVPKEVQKILMEKYRSPIMTPELEAKAKEVGGHGGMDFIMDYRLIYCLQNGLPLDMDVYDMAEWCSVAPLSVLSIENNSSAVEVPDFTRGGWDRIHGFSHAMIK